MRKLEITIPVRVYAYDELDEARRKLIDRAKEATGGSYAPYSNFNVGAAIELATGEIVTGANQENAAFSSGTCAERSACFSAGALHKGVPMRRIAIAAYTAGAFQRKPISPCGACRQALLEYEMRAGHDVPVILAGALEIYCLPSVKSLLPFAFTEF